MFYDVLYQWKGLELARQGCDWQDMAQSQQVGGARQFGMTLKFASLNNFYSTPLTSSFEDVMMIGYKYRYNCFLIRLGPSLQ